MAVHGRSLRNGPGRTGASQASLGQCTTNGPQCQARRAKKPQRRGSRLLTPSAAAPRSGPGLDARSYNERPGGGPHAPCRDTRFTIFGLSTMPKKRRGAPPGPRPRLRSGAREARPMGDSPGAAGKGGEARPQASRPPEPPSGGGGAGGAQGRAPRHAQRHERGTSKPAQARARSKAPGGAATRPRPKAAGPPGPEAAAPEAREAGRGGGDPAGPRAGARRRRSGARATEQGARSRSGCRSPNQTGPASARGAA